MLKKYKKSILIKNDNSAIFCYYKKIIKQVKQFYNYKKVKRKNIK